MNNKKIHILLSLLFLFLSGICYSQINNYVTDPRGNNHSTVVYPIGNYSMLPQPMIPVFHPQPKVVMTPFEILTVYPNIQVHPSSTTTQTETPLVSGRGNNNFMFGSSIAITGLNTNCGSYISTNGGYTWFGQDYINTGNPNNERGDPAPVIDKNGRVVFAHFTSNTNFGSVTGIGAEYSTNFGQNFSTTFQISIDPYSDKILSGTDDSPSSPYYGNSYVVWTSFSTNPVNGRFSRTTNGGVTWSSPLILNSTPANYFAQGHNVDALPNGNVIACWTLGENTFTGTEKFVGIARSTNGGLNFTVNEEAYAVNGTRSGSFNGWSVRINGFPSMSIDKTGGPRNGWIYIVTDEYNHSPAGSDADVVLHRSTDGGITWSSGIRVNQDALNNGKVQFFPAVRVDEAGGVNVAYYDNRNFTSVGDSCSVFISRSIDGGNTWNDVEIADHHFLPKVVPLMSGGYMGDYIGITCSGGKVWVLWMDDKSGIYNAWAGYIYAGAQTAHDIACGPLLSLPANIVLNQTYTIKTKVYNAGTSNESNIPIKFLINGSLINTLTINLNSNQTDSVSTNWTPSSTGSYLLTFISSLPGDTNRINDTIRAQVFVYSSLPSLCEGFNITDFPPVNWSVIYNGTNFWSRQLSSSYCLGTGSAKYDFYDAAIGTQQQLTTSNFNPTISDTLKFAEAYCTYQNENDRLQIFSSTNGGAVWNLLITLDGGVNGSLVTAPPQTNPFMPSCSQWKNQSIPLPAGTNKIKFNAISAFGNNLYLDSICLFNPIGIHNIKTQTPKEFTLMQNYPNPFNPYTTINYNISERRFVTLIVYDLSGREVVKLVNEEKQAGYYNVRFKGDNYSSGVYFYKLSAGEFTAVRKMLLIK